METEYHFDYLFLIIDVALWGLVWLIVFKLIAWLRKRFPMKGLLIIALLAFCYLNFSQTMLLYELKGALSGEGHPFGGGARYGFPLPAYESVCSDAWPNGHPPPCDSNIDTKGLVIDIATWATIFGLLIWMERKSRSNSSSNVVH